MDEPFNATYYSTIAQIIPVYFLAIVGAGVVYRRELFDGPMLGLFFLSMAGFVVLGEVVAISALSEREEPSNMGEMAIVGAIALPLLAIPGAVIRVQMDHLRPYVPWWVRITGGVVFVAALIALTVSVVTGGDPADVAVGVLTGVFFLAYVGAGVVGIVSDARRLRSKNQE